jgi:beta-lactamase regulating signal transducer with metallopeptidase domain
MIGALIFSAVAAALVYQAGRSDPARDPRLTGTVLVLLAAMPFMVVVLPKFPLIPRGVGGAVGAGFPWMAALSGLWAAGFLIALLRLFLAARGLARWRRRSRLVGRSGRIEIRELADLAGPVAAGVFHPVIYVPAIWTEWPERVREIVLDHESAHHSRRDPLWRWLAGIALAVNWFNPLVWWMARRLSLQCEFACDARVLGGGTTAADYARLLCDLAEDRISRGPAPAMAERASLEQRVRRLGSPRLPARAAAVPLMITAALVAAAALALVGPESSASSGFPDEEARIRWSADPFAAVAEW